jgi:transcription antitermination factor NusG
MELVFEGRHECDSEGEAMSSVQVIANQALIPALAQAQWYAVQTRPRHEKKVVTELNQKYIASYLPLLPQVHHWSDRRKVVQVPLFPGYVFVRAQLDNVRVAIRSIWGVLAFVGPQREATAIPDTQIEDIRTLLSTKVSLSPYPFIKVGQRVRVRGGALDGLEGILVTNGQKRLVISVESIQRSLSITIDGYDIEPA